MVEPPAPLPSHFVDRDLRLITIVAAVEVGITAVSNHWIAPLRSALESFAQTEPHSDR